MNGSTENIVRRSADGSFTTVANAALRDPRISYRAKGLLASCLSHADGFTLSRAWIDSHGTEGREAITNAIRELRAFGYVMDEYQQPEPGRPVRRKLVWTDCPQDHPPDDGTQCNRKPVALKTRGTENPSHFKKNNLQEEQKKENQEEENQPLPFLGGSAMTTESKTPREQGANPPALGTNERALGVNPRSGRSSKDFKPTHDDIPTELLGVAHEIIDFWAEKEGSHSSRAWSGYLTELAKIHQDPAGGTEVLREQLNLGIQTGTWKSCTHAKWQRYGKPVSPLLNGGSGRYASRAERQQSEVEKFLGFCDFVESQTAQRNAPLQTIDL